jgi:hypothetical protein
MITNLFKRAKHIASGSDPEYARKLLLSTNIEKAVAQDNGIHRGAVTTSFFGGELSEQELVWPLSVLIACEKGKPHTFGFGFEIQLDRLRYQHKRKGDRELIDLVFGITSGTIGFMGIRRTKSVEYTVQIRGKTLDHKLKDVSGVFPDLKEPLKRAKRDFYFRCMCNSLLPHSSKVHTFEDTVNQAYVLAIPSRDHEEAYKIAMMTFFTHQFDDLIDPRKDITRLLDGFDGTCTTAAEKLPEAASRIIDNMLNLAPQEKKEYAARTIISMIYGSLIQRAKTPKEQERYAKDFHNSTMGSVKDNAALASQIKMLQPMQLWLTTHAGMEAFFALEKGNDDTSLGPLFSLFYAPMLYCHDREEEESGEKVRVMYGKELCEGKHISDRALLPLLDAFDNSHDSCKDKRKQEHLQQMQIVYKAFEQVLSPKLKERYCQSMDMYSR